ncbi:MAG TPA: hypothetical protein DCS97_00995 [Planctomycetes bacterium]|nr:hypothetical protein [Planctomycetota bacterium]
MDGPVIPGFTFAGRIASGRHGTVWSARRQDVGDEVAVKIVPTAQVSDAERFLREAEVLSDIDHPHVIRCLAHGRHGDHLWIAMEPAASDLAVEMRAGTCPPNRILEAGRGAAAGLAVIHALGLVHRDITPANLLRMRDGRVVIGDFGLIHGGHERLTATGEVLGTPAYLSPEQADGIALDPRSDIYALGAVLFALATGRPPYVADGAWGVLALITAGPFPDPRLLRPDLPLELRAIIRAATGLQREDRYEAIGLLGEDCQAVLAGGTPRNAGKVRSRLSASAASRAAAEPPAGPASRTLRPVLTAAAVGLGLGVVLGWVVGRPDALDRQALAAAWADGSRETWELYLRNHPRGSGVDPATRALSIINDEQHVQRQIARSKLEQDLDSLEAELARLRETRP